MGTDNGGDRLVLVVSASYVGAVGFGEIFNCQIDRIVSGALDAPSIRLSIMPKHKDWLALLRAHLHPAQVEIGFNVHQHNEPYNTAPISGFVDPARTSWNVEFIRPVRE